MIFLLSLAFADVPEYTYLEAGMEAPFSGRLFNDTASQLLADQVANATDRCQIEMDYQVGITLAEKEEEIRKLKSSHKFEVQILEAEVQALETRIEGLEELKTPPKKKFWFSLGLISGIGITIAIAQAVN
jgi:vacuolar-type H+-ATPase subunit I/STV1